MKIQVLSQSTIDRIAAGEVVDRPISVIKELVENSLDAHATAVSVEIQNGGVDFIRVTDNGDGIPEEDVPTAFLPHATGKIRSVEDFNTLTTMGFRGEALPSIAAVAEVEMITKTKESLTAFSYEIRGGREVDSRSIGAPNGTTVFVRHLFFNTPARLKFLKSPATEAAAVGDMMEKLALSHPEIRFKLTVNGHVRISTSGDGQLKNTIYTLFGRETMEEVIPVETEREGITIRGFLGKPVLAKGNRNFEIYFVNHRYVKAKAIEKGIEDGYEGRLMLHRYPVAVLSVTMDPALVDCNVHPQKTEIRFSNEGQVYDRIRQVVSETLAHREFIPKEAPDEPEKILYPSPEPFLRPAADISYKGKSPDENLSENPKKANDFAENFEYNSKKDSGEPAFPSLSKTEKPAPSVKQESFLDRLALKKYRLIGQVFETYWLLEMDDTLYILDQHAAHEKVLFEEKCALLRKESILSAKLYPPVVFSLSSAEEAVCNQYADALEQFGFEIRPFGENEYALFAVPEGMFKIDPKELFLDLLSDYSAGSRKTPEEIVLRIAKASCKAAVKANDRLSAREAEKLLDKLLSLENPFQCPHGRPTLIEFTKADIEKRFKRIV